MGGNDELGYQCEPVGCEELAWRVDPDALEGVPKSRRRIITGTYCAAGRSGQFVLRPLNVRRGPTRQARNPLTRESLRARRAPGALGLRARRSPPTRQPQPGPRPPLPHAILR